MAWQLRAQRLKLEVYTLYLAARDSRGPWYAKAFAACVAGYAFSPIDLIPDFIPVLGHLDDIVLIPLGVLAFRHMIPSSVLADCREGAHLFMQQGRPVNRIAAGVVVAVWALAAAGTAWLVCKLPRPVR